VAVLDFGPWLARVRPVILRVEYKGNRATAFLRLEINETPGRRTVRPSLDLIAIPLVREDSTWLIADASYFLVRGGLLRDTRTQAERKAEETARTLR